MTLRHSFALATGIVIVAASLAAQAPASPLSVANLTRLRLLTQAQGVEDPFPARLAELFGLGMEDIQAKQVMANSLGREFYLVFLDRPGGEIVLTIKEPTRISVYLTDATRELRRAAVTDNTGTRLVSGELVVAAFGEALQRWNELAITQAGAK